MMVSTVRDSVQSIVRENSERFSFVHEQEERTGLGDTKMELACIVTLNLHQEKHNSRDAVQK